MTPSPGGPADFGVSSSRTGRPVCLSVLNPLPAVLFPERGHSRHGCTGAQLAPVSLLAQTLCKVREDEEQVLLVAPHWPSRTWFSEMHILENEQFSNVFNYIF